MDTLVHWMSYIQQINWDKPLQGKKNQYAEHYFISF